MKFLLILLFATATASAEDLRTTQGREFHDVTVSRVEPDGLILITKTGIVKVYFSELPKEVQERYHYEPEAAESFARQDAERQRALQRKMQEDQRARSEQEQAAIRARSQSKERTTTMVLPQLNSAGLPNGRLIKPEIVAARDVAEHPFSLRDKILEVVAIKDAQKREIAEGVYRMEMWTGHGWLVAELTFEQCDSIARAGRMFIRVKPQEHYDSSVPIEVVGTGVTYAGLSTVPTFIWK